MMKVIPITQKAAFRYVKENHRHHISPVGSIFQIALWDGEKIIGVGIVGRPNSRMQEQQGKDTGEFACEVTRTCTNGTENACSKIYGVCARIAKEMGYKIIRTYTLISEPGTSLKASGWINKGERGGGSWSVPSRRRIDKHPLEKKILWEKLL